MVNDLTLIEKIRREQDELAADLEKFLETERQATAADIEAIQSRQAEISKTIEEIAQNQQ